MLECDVWSGKVNRGGYPVNPSGHLIHRLRYAAAHPGLDLRGREVHHVCGKKLCIEAEHLVDMDPTEHRQLHTQLRRAAQTHCVQGHEWTEENTVLVTDSDGYECRRCRACRLERQAVYRIAHPYVPVPKKLPPTHCIHGHEYTEENSGYNRGKRYCKECNRIRVRNRYARLREAEKRLLQIENDKLA